MFLRERAERRMQYATPEKCLGRMAFGNGSWEADSATVGNHYILLFYKKSCKETLAFCIWSGGYSALHIPGQCGTSHAVPDKVL